MQNYHTANTPIIHNPLAAIMAAIREANPTKGVTARQIAEATGLSMQHTVVPALAGYLRSGIIRGVPVDDIELHVVLTATTPSLVDTNDPAEVEAHMVDEGMIAERPACEGCNGKGITRVWVIGRVYEGKCAECGGTGRQAS